MTKDMPLVGVTLSPQVEPNTDWYARTILKSDSLIPASTAPTSLAYNITPRTYSFQTRRGRTYDLGRLEAGQCELRVNNSDGLFDPNNTGSPLYPNVDPYRPVRITAAYPRTGNILNDTNKGLDSKRVIAITQAVGDGTKIIYTAAGQIPFHQGQVISVTGMGAANATSYQLFQTSVHAMTTTFQIFKSGFTGTVTANGFASLDLPATLSDGAVSVCANDSNFELGVVSNWYNFSGTGLSIQSSGHSGSYSLQIASTKSAMLDVPCVAGQYVTFSVWVRSFSSSVNGGIRLYEGGYIDGSSSYTSNAFVTSGSWIRYSVTAIATAPKITVEVYGNANILLVDDIQVEFGKTATTNTTTGSTVYNLFNGFVERYPQSYQAPNRGEVNMTATDVVSMMSQNYMLNPYLSLIIQDPATYYFYPLSEDAVKSVTVSKAVSNGSTVVYSALNDFEVGQPVYVQGLSVSGYNTSTKTIVAADYQSFTVSYATTVGILENESGSAYVGNVNSKCYYSYGDYGFASTSGAGAVVELGNTKSQSLLGFDGETCLSVLGSSTASAYISTPVYTDAQTQMTTYGWLVEAWVNFSTAGTFMQLASTNGITKVKVDVNTLSATYTPFTSNASGTSSGTTATITTTTAHGLSTGDTVTLSGFTPSGYNGTYVITVTTTTKFRVTTSGSTLGAGTGGIVAPVAKLDGVANPFPKNTWELIRVSHDGTSLTVEMVDKASSSVAVAGNIVPPTVQIGSISNSSFDGFAKNLRIADLRSLTNITSDLFLLGATGDYNDSTGYRVQSLFQNYSGFSFVPVSANMGAFTMQQINSKDNSLFDVVQTVADSEFGYWFVDGSGMVTFKDAYTRQYPTTPVLTIGDGAGEIPYQGGDYVINYDLTFVYNQIDISRVNGGNFYAQDSTSVDKYFPRSLSVQVENASDAQLSSGSPLTFPIADIYLNRYAYPIMRPDHIVLTPSRNPAIWDEVLGLEIGDYIKVVKRPIGGNPITVYGWVENIEHSFDGQTSDWLTNLVFSPAPAPL